MLLSSCWCVVKVLLTCCWGVAAADKAKAPDHDLFDQWSSSEVKAPDNVDLSLGEDVLHGVAHQAKAKSLLQELWDFLVRRSGIGHAVVARDSAKKASGQRESPRPQKTRPTNEVEQDAAEEAEVESEGEEAAEFEIDAQVEIDAPVDAEVEQDAQVEVEEDANVEVAADEKDAEQDAEGADATHCVRLRDANIMKTLDQELTCDFYFDGEGGADEDDLDPEDEKVHVEPESRQDIMRKARAGVKAKRKSLPLLALSCSHCAPFVKPL